MARTLPLIVLMLLGMIGLYSWSGSDQESENSGIGASGTEIGPSTAERDRAEIAGLTEVDSVDANPSDVPAEPKTRLALNTEFIASVTVRWSNGDPAPTGRLLILDPKDGELVNVLYEDGAGTSHLPNGDYRIENVLHDGYPQEVESMTFPSFSPGTPTVEIVLVPEVEANPDYAHFFVVDDVSGRQLKDVQIRAGSRALKFDEMSIIREGLGLGPDAQPGLGSNRPRPLRLNTIRSGNSPLAFPMADGNQEYWVHAKGYAWALVRMGPQKRITVPLTAAGSITLSVVGDEGLYDKLVLMVRDGNDEVEHTVPIDDEIRLEPLKAGNAIIAIRGESQLAIGQVLMSQSIHIVAGQSTPVTLDMQQRGSTSNTAAVRIHIQMDRKESVRPKTATWTYRNSDFHSTSIPGRKLPLRGWQRGSDLESVLDQTHEGLQAGEYVFGLPTMGVTRTVVLQPGQLSEIHVDLRPRIRIEVTPTSDAVEELKKAFIQFHWQYEDSPPNTPFQKNTTTRFRQGTPTTLYVLPGRIRLESASLDWHFPNPVLDIPTLEGAALTIHLEHRANYSANIRFVRNGTDAKAASHLLRFVQVEAIRHDGVVLGRDHRAMHSESGTDTTYFVRVSKPGSYRFTYPGSSHEPVVQHIDANEQTVELRID